MKISLQFDDYPIDKELLPDYLRVLYPGVSLFAETKGSCELQKQNGK